MHRFTRRTAVVATFLTVSISGGAAFAFWLNGATATAEGQTAQGTKLTVTNLLTGSAALTPGAQQYWTFQANNDGDAATTIDTTASTITITPFSKTDVDPSKPACTQADYEINTIYLPGSVGAHSNSGGSFYLKFLNDPASDQANCKSVKVPLSVNIQAVS